MQYQNGVKREASNGGGAPTSSTASVDALHVLAATASNDHLRERYRDDQSSSSQMSSLSNGAKRREGEQATGGNKSSADEDDAGSRVSSGSGGSSSGSDGVSKQTGLRKGKWTVEEEEYATRFIHYFSSGLLTLPEGKTLRASLAEKLSCDPMRITKKYAGASCLGNKISRLCDRPKFSSQDIEMARLEIARLERRFQMRLAQGVGVPLPPDSSSPPMSVSGAAGSSQSRSLSGSVVGIRPLTVVNGGHVHHHRQQQRHHHQHPHHLAHEIQLEAASTHGGSSNFGQSVVPIVPVIHPGTTATSVTSTGSPDSTTGPISATTVATTAPAPSIQTYLAALANNAQLAAASLASNPAPGGNSPPVAAAPVSVIGSSQQHHQQQALHAAAASLPPGVAPMLVGATQAQQQPAPAPTTAAPTIAAPTLVHQQPVAVAQATPAAQLPGLAWPGSMLLQQDLGQATVRAVNGTAAPSPAASQNEQLVQTLLLQITSQLQALATLSPQTLRQIQLQILASTMAVSPTAAVAAPAIPHQAAVPAAPAIPHHAAVPAPAPVVMSQQQQQVRLPPGLTPEAATLLSNFQLAATGQLGLTPAVAAPAQKQHPSLQHLLSTAAAAAPVAQQQMAQPPAAVSSFLNNPYGLSSLAANAGVAASAPVANGNVLLHPPHGSAANPAVAVSGSGTSQAHLANQVSPTLQQSRKRHSIDVAAPEVSHISAPAGLTSVPTSLNGATPRSSSAPNALPGHPHNMAEFLNKLRQGHAEAVEQVRREAEMLRRGSKSEESASTFTKVSSRSSSSLTASSMDQGPVTKKQKQGEPGTNGMVALLPFEHATTVSSLGGTTNEGSTSSIENRLPSDETRNDGSNDESTSSNSLSEEEYTEPESMQRSSSSTSEQRRSSVPLRKRFRSEKKKDITNNVDGITRRNLADHDFRMNAQLEEELKHQEK